MTENTNIEITPESTKKLRPRKGRHIRVVDGKDIIAGTTKEEAIEALDKFTFETGVPKTLHQWMVDFGYDHWVLFRHIRDNAKIVGKAQTKNRGKKPDLYQFQKNV